MINPNFTKAINWNNIEDLIDKSTWEKLTEQFWLDTPYPTFKRLGRLAQPV
jgi:ribonucleoside-diphosphate reductase beta chain